MQETQEPWRGSYLMGTPDGDLSCAFSSQAQGAPHRFSFKGSMNG